jgi:3'-phosphoadenosine 5'-phosphosulfate sulfotransferase (PAPS reductase)/FAD synthetase
MVDPDPIIDGSRVETMIETGRKIVAQAFEEFRPIAILAAFSGGNDSVVSTHFGVNEFGASVFHCGTGIGLEATERHILNIAARFRWDLRIARAQPQGKSKSIDVTMLPSRQWTEGETAYEEYVLNFGFPGPSQHARCFQRLKERPMRQIQREIKQGHS